MNNMLFAAPMGSSPCALGLFCCCSSCFCLCCPRHRPVSRLAAVVGGAAAVPAVVSGVTGLILSPSQSPIFIQPTPSPQMLPPRPGLDLVFVNQPDHSAPLGEIRPSAPPLPPVADLPPLGLRR
nr:multi-functional protein [Paslahepevirus balayani]UZC02901.1 multi-functional protein [Paslahepevirus balayani]UZC02904.1 multi-functional protein [Paslahepevirus balayani]UZC02907.1 multi-functional protein [Paslahepevirus balayani]UZC02910.1 multi-functional protein [Paslahepevirus balayani]